MDIPTPTPTPTWHPNKPRMLLVGTSINDETTKIWASLCASKDTEKTPMIKLYIGDSTTTTNRSTVSWSKEFNLDQFTGPKAKRHQARMNKIRDYFSTSSSTPPSTTSAELSTTPQPQPSAHTSLSSTLADRYHQEHPMSDEEVKTARSIMIENGMNVPPLAVMIQAKRDSLAYQSSMSPSEAGCWTEWQYQHHNGFGEPCAEALANGIHLPMTYTLTTVSNDTVDSILELVGSKLNDDCGTAKLSRFYAWKFGHDE